MKFIEPLPLSCPRCTTKSQHMTDQLLALAAACPSCGFRFDEEGRRLGVEIDEHTALWSWAELLLEIENRLSLPLNSIPDGDVFDRPLVQATLREVERVVDPFVSAGTDTVRLVLESASAVARQSLSPADLDLPILQALRVTHWTPRHAG